MRASSEKALGKFLKVFLPVGISALAVWLVLRNVDFATLAAAFRSITISTLIFCCLTYLVGMFLRAGAWHLILGRQFNFRRVFLVLNAGYLLNNVLPFRLGEVGRALLLGSDDPSRPGKLEVLSSIVVERIYDLFLASVFFLSTLPFVIVAPTARLLAIAVLALVLLAFAFVVWASRRRLSIIAWLQKRPQKAFAWLLPKLDELLKGFSVLNRPRLFLASFGLMLLSWVLSMIQQTSLRLTLMPDSAWWWVIFILASGAFGGALPSAPASLGVFEAAVVGAFALLGVPQAPALAFALIVHMIHLLFSSIFGMLGLITSGQSITSLYQKARQQRTAQVDV